MLSLRVLGFCVLSTLAPIAIGCTAASDETEEEADSDDQAISSPARAAANKLFEEAERDAKKRVGGAACSADTTVASIVGKLNDAVTKVPTKSFRKKVASSKPIRKAVGHTLDYHFVVGTITVEDGVVLGLKNAIADAESGIEIYGAWTSRLGQVTKVGLYADGRATFFGRSLDPETGKAGWTELQWSWSLTETVKGTKIDFVTEQGDASSSVKLKDGTFIVGAGDEAMLADQMTSLPRECAR